MPQSFRNLARALGASLVLAHAAAFGQADPAAAPDPSVRELVEQNRQLQKRVESQQKQIDELRDRLDHVPQEAAARAEAGPPVTETPVRALPAAEGDHQIRISGDAGIAWFSGGGDSAYPTSEFHVDEARLFVEAPIWHNVYSFVGLDLMTREGGDDYFHLGEFYLDMEDVLSFGRKEGLNLRVGRFNIPFGEEYQNRYVMENPLITHSLSDIWGYDTGVEAYGSFAGVQYVIAVQNGGTDKNKEVTARLGYNPLPSLHLSVSGHNTGKLDVTNDYVSAMWFGGAFFRGVAPAADARSFEASVFELDASWHWKGGHFGADGGLVRYHDDSPTVDNSRNLHYYSFEAVQQLVGNLSGAARFSEIRASGGYPLMGQGNGGKYFYNPFAPLTSDLQRLSLGFSYLFGPPFVWKVEYSFEHGHLANGSTRNAEDLLSTEIGIRF